MSDTRTPTTGPSNADREIIFFKLQLLASVVDMMEKDVSMFDDDAYFALSSFMTDLALAVYPEWLEPSQRDG
jgi:hypothetical protein